MAKRVECAECGSPFHYQTFCPFKKRKAIAVNKLPNKIGKAGKRTQKAVQQWKKSQRPNHEGYYICYMCGAWVTYLVAEHVKSKARHPELRADPNNLKPTCDDCNREKGSKDN